jgi:hypothetical protein
MMWVQRNRKKSIVAGTILLFVVSFMAMYISFLFPGKLKLADRVRTELMKSTINALEEIEKTGQRLTLANFHNKEISTLSYDDLVPYLHSIESGTVFFTSHGKIVSNFIPGNWTHTGFYLGTQKQLQDKFGASSTIYKSVENFYRTGEEHLIIDSSLRRGCAVRDIMEMAALGSKSTLRSILCFEPKISPAQLQHVLQNSLAETGKKYDLSFSMDDKSKIYCTELIYDAFQLFGITINQRTPIFFRNILLPKDMVDEIIEKHMTEFNLKLCLVKNNNQIQDLDYTEILSLVAGILLKKTN